MTQPPSQRSGSARAAAQEKIDALRQLADAHLAQIHASQADLVQQIPDAMLDLPLHEFLRSCNELEQANAAAVAAPAPTPSLPAQRDPSLRQSIQVRARPSIGGAALSEEVAELDRNSLALNIGGTLLTVPLQDDGSGDQAVDPLAALPNLDEAARRKIDAKMRELRALLAAELGGLMAENMDG
ncbi:hypothetical protein AMAG_13410 [Allomyces macrogynus ATCC 38327]|uniref:Uncharacterized protein n=1 Tax=Allomyces macrogynus (strain ATCC 38327) TaxID=578462 RepID=A0A0L0T287_ALLM3|nr:hypothetical protein AMAG_13410 [Allomyces macrogynus ATCC 38327]|eukprot:KNE68770.1 hypothetical protein AMAG_13410 [Allomyces macrogynus ATCC 38327]